MSAGDQEQRNKIIGENIHKYRLQKGVKQEEAAEGICSISQWSRMETGKVRLNEGGLPTIAERLGVTLTQLMSADAVLMELQEMMDLIRALPSEDQRGWSMVQEVLEKSREYAYWDLFAEAAYMQTTVLHWQNKFAEIEEFVSGVLAENNPIASHQKALLNLQACTACRSFGDFMRANEYLQQAEHDVDTGESDDPMVTMRMYRALTNGYFTISNYRKALRYAQRTVEIATELKNLLGRNRSLSMIGRIHHYLGNWELAEEALLTALQEAQANSIVFDMATTDTFLGALYKQWGRPAQAKVHLQRSVKLYEMGNYTRWVCFPLVTLAEVAVEQGDLQEATSWSQKVLQISESFASTARFDRGAAYKVLGQVKAAQEDFEGYVRYLDTAIREYGEEYPSTPAYKTSVELADALYQRQDKRALAAYRRVIALDRIIVAMDKLVK